MTSSTHGSLEYLDPHSPSELFNHTFSPPPPGKAQTNVVTHPVRVSISSLRALPSTATGFDTQHAGFELVRAFGGPEAENGWKEGKGTDEEWIKTVYYEDCKSLVKDRLSESGTLGNVKEVVVFDHTIRRRGAANVGPTSRAPVARGEPISSNPLPSHLSHR